MDALKSSTKPTTTQQTTEVTKPVPDQPNDFLSLPTREVSIWDLRPTVSSILSRNGATSYRVKVRVSSPVRCRVSQSVRTSSPVRSRVSQSVRTSPVRSRVSQSVRTSSVRNRVSQFVRTSSPVRSRVSQSVRTSSVRNRVSQFVRTSSPVRSRVSPSVRTSSLVRSRVSQSRNTKQVKNILSQEKYEKALSKDYIYNLVLLAYQLNGFISEILVYPDLLAVVALPEIIETFKDIIELKSDEPVYLVYDKTFNLG